MQHVIKGDKPVILVDDRERNSSLYESLKQRNVLLRVSRIDVGDYILSDRFVVERKAMPDFESSIIDGRLFSQAKLLTAYERPIMIVEPGINGRLNRKVVMGAVASLLADYSIPVLFLDADDASLLMERIAFREQVKDKRPVGIVKKPKAFNADDARIRILSGFPGINAKTAEKLLSHFHSLSRLFSSSLDELMEVEGIGRKKAEKIFKIIHEEYKHSRGDAHEH